MRAKLSFPFVSTNGRTVRIQIKAFIFFNISWNTIVYIIMVDLYIYTITSNLVFVFTKPFFK